MKILISPQAFKGSLSAKKVAEAIQSGIHRYLSNISTVLLPVADGGDGFLDILMSAVKGSYRIDRVTGPLGKKVDALWGIIKEQIAVIELAQICGLSMVSAKDRNPLVTTTYGVGEVIRAALDEGIRDFLIGIGGSATNDGGVGIAQALGARFLDREGKEIFSRGDALVKLHCIDLTSLDPRLQNSHIAVACDVTNPLTGPDGATLVYAQQKGAALDGVDTLEKGLCRFATVVEQQYGINVNAIPCSGSAGGAGGGLYALLGAELQLGIDLVLQHISFDRHLEGAHLVITGEGCMDGQTVYHKAPIGVAKRAKAKGVPVVAIVGFLGKGYEKVHEQAIDGIIPLSFAPLGGLALEQPTSLIEMAAEQAIRLVYLND